MCNIILALISFFFYLFIFPSHLSACRHFCDFLREEFIEMRVLQPDGSASTSLFSLPPCASPHLLALLSALFQMSLCLIHRGEDLGGSARQRLGPVRRLLYHLFNPRPLLAQKSSPPQNRLPLQRRGRLFPEVVCSGRPPVWMRRMRTFAHILGRAFHVLKKELKKLNRSKFRKRLSFGFAGLAAGRGERRFAAMCCL